MKEIVVYDTEYWTCEGAPSRCWGGLDDKPPYLVQIGAIKLALSSGLPLLGEFQAFVTPVDHQGHKMVLPEFFYRLTHISPEKLEAEGKSLIVALNDFKGFCGDVPIYSYGSDMLRTIVPSCYISQIACPFPPKQACDIRHLLMEAGVSRADIEKNSSGTIAKSMAVDMPDDHFAHDAFQDVLSLVALLRDLDRKGRILSLPSLNPV